MCIVRQRGRQPRRPATPPGPGRPHASLTPPRRQPRAPVDSSQATIPSAAGRPSASRPQLDGTAACGCPFDHEAWTRRPRVMRETPTSISERRGGRSCRILSSTWSAISNRRPIARPVDPPVGARSAHQPATLTCGAVRPPSRYRLAVRRRQTIIRSPCGARPYGCRAGSGFSAPGGASSSPCSRSGAGRRRVSL